MFHKVYVDAASGARAANNDAAHRRRHLRSRDAVLARKV